jgi:addiction module HigA family antidote
MPWSDEATGAPPGARIAMVLQEKGMTQTELAERLGRPLSKINEIINGKRAITPGTAHALELVLGDPAGHWMKLEADFRLAQKRLEAEQHFRRESEALARFPVGEMIKLGWLEKGDTDVDTTKNLLGFFGITSFDNLESPSVMGAAFRKSQAREACNYALAAWLRKGSLEAERIKTQSFSSCGLMSCIGELRSLSLLQYGQFRARLTDLCASYGVAVVTVPHLPKSYASGAARWIGDKAMIQLSLRFRTNDHFWFSFFHELAHILLHSRANWSFDVPTSEHSVYLDDFIGCDGDKEREANAFSADKLIPPDAYLRLKEMDYRRARVVRRFASDIGIAPGIVVGRLQHDQLIPYGALNDLKESFGSDRGQASEHGDAT